MQSNRGDFIDLGGTIGNGVIYRVLGYVRGLISPGRYNISIGPADGDDLAGKWTVRRAVGMLLPRKRIFSYAERGKIHDGRRKLTAVLACVSLYTVFAVAVTGRVSATAGETCAAVYGTFLYCRVFGVRELCGNEAWGRYFGTFLLYSDRLASGVWYIFSDERVRLPPSIMLFLAVVVHCFSSGVGRLL